MSRLIAEAIEKRWAAGLVDLSPLQTRGVVPETIFPSAAAPPSKTPWARVVWQPEPGKVAQSHPNAPPGTIALRSDADVLAVVPDLSDLTSQFDFTVTVQSNEPNDVFVVINAQKRNGQSLGDPFLVFFLPLSKEDRFANALVLGSGEQPNEWKMIHRTSPISLTDRYQSWFNNT